MLAPVETLNARGYQPLMNHPDGLRPASHQANARRGHWQLNPNVAYLNHGSFGATPTVVLDAQRVLRDELERDPIAFLAPERQLEPKLDRVRDAISELVGADATDIAFVRNATDGVNAVLRSFPFHQDDEVVVTNHGYNACNNAARFAAQMRGANVLVANVPFPLQSSNEVVEAIERSFTTRTKLLLVDHVTSATGLVFPIKAIVESARRRNIRVLVDGAHAAGMLPLNLNEIDADYYTANHHKWLCAPKVSGFLWVRRELQPEVRPTIISHAFNRPRPNRSQFHAEFDWQGTFDPTPILSVPASIGFLNSLYPGGIAELMMANRKLAIDARALLLEVLGIDEPTPKEMLGSLVTLPLPRALGDVQSDGEDPLQQILRQRYCIELPVFRGSQPGSRLLRIALQAYNDLDQIRRLADALRREMR